MIIYAVHYHFLTILKAFVDNNSLKSIAHEIASLPKLAIVDFSHNELTNLDNTYFFHTKYFDLSNNKFNFFPEGIINEKIVVIVLAHNNIRKIPDSIRHALSLNKLDLSHNAIWYVPKTFDELVSLKTLDLSFNQLTYFISDITRALMLEELYLDNNLIRYIPTSLKNMEHLEIISIKNNQITDFPEVFYDPLFQYAKLNLSFNNLRTLPEALKDKTGLNKVNLRGNYFSPATKKEFSSLKTDVFTQATIGYEDRIFLF